MFLLDALPLRTKRKSVEVYLTGKRLEEEIILLEEEMLRFLCYYKDKVIPALSKRLHSLEKGVYCLILQRCINE